MISYEYKYGMYRNENGELISWLLDFQTGEIETNSMGIVPEDFFEELNNRVEENKKIINSKNIEKLLKIYPELFFKDITENKKAK